MFYRVIRAFEQAADIVDEMLVGDPDEFDDLHDVRGAGGESTAVGPLAEPTWAWPATARPAAAASSERSGPAAPGATPPLATHSADRGRCGGADRRQRVPTAHHRRPGQVPAPTQTCLTPLPGQPGA